MSRYPIKLSHLREIGWSEWDPIGLKGEAQESDTVAGEYDSYLLHVASLFHQGRSDTEAIDYLITIATQHMGLPTANRAAAERTVKAIRNYIENLPST